MYMKNHSNCIITIACLYSVMFLTGCATSGTNGGATGGGATVSQTTQAPEDPQLAEVRRRLENQKKIEESAMVAELAAQHKKSEVPAKYQATYDFSAASGAAEKQKLEDHLLDQIKNEAGRNSFNIPEIKPSSNGSVCSFTFVENTNQTKFAYAFVQMENHDVEYDFPKDSFELLYQNGQLLSPDGENSVIRFKGEVKYRGFWFQGDQTDPLVFIFTKVGFVYVKGQGKVLQAGSMIIRRDFHYKSFGL